MGDNGGPQHPDKRRAGGHTVSIEDAIHGLAMLPTPRATRGGSSTETTAMLPTPRATDGTKGGPNQRGSSGDLMLPSAVAMLPTPVVTDSLGARNATSGRKDGSQHHGGTTLGDVAYLGQFGQYTPAVTRQVDAFGYPAPPPTEPGKNRPRLSARFAEWMMGLPPGWITDVPGVTRNEALRLAGNGVVPPQAAAALRDMLPHALAALREGQAA